MKYLVLLVVLVVAYMLWRNARIEKRAAPPPPAPPRGNPPAPQEMIGCTVCNVHLPRGDAVAGGDGRLYCSAEHRLRGDATPR